MVFLLKAGYDPSQLQKMSDGDHRNTVITYIHTNTDEPVPALQALGDGELVRWGFAIKGDTALATTAMRMGA